MGGSATSAWARTSTRSGYGRSRAARWTSTSGTPAMPPTRWRGSSRWAPSRMWPRCGSGANARPGRTPLTKLRRPVGVPAAVAGDVGVQAAGVLGFPQHHGERQLAAGELDDRELELRRFGGQQRAELAHGHVVQLAEDRLAAVGHRIQAGELVTDRIEAVERGGPPLPPHWDPFQ